MSIAVLLEEEDGTVVDGLADPTNLLARITTWRPEDLAQLRLLRYLEPYGNLVLNAAQARDLLLDIGALMAVARDDEEAAFLERFAAFARRLRDEDLVYIRLAGD